MIEIKIEKDKDYSKPVILCNLLYSGFDLFEETLETEKFSKKDYKELNNLFLQLGFLVYSVCDIVEKYEK